METPKSIKPTVTKTTPLKKPAPRKRPKKAPVDLVEPQPSNIVPKIYDVMIFLIMLCLVMIMTILIKK